MKPYEPINVLKAVTDDIWIVDGPIIRMRFPGFTMPFPTRMTIIRLGQGNLLIHSPTVLTPELRSAIQVLGTPRYLIGPSWLHYWWLPDWKQAFPEAQVFVADGVRARAGAHIDFTTETLERTQGYPWDAAVSTLPANGKLGTEVIFFHKESRTLILSDFIENFEPSRVDSIIMRFFIRIGGVQAPHGGMPRDMRLSYSREALRACVATMMAWEPARIILAHGRWYEKDGAAELRRAFQDVLPEAYTSGYTQKPAA